MSVRDPLAWSPIQGEARRVMSSQSFTNFPLYREQEGKAIRIDGPKDSRK